MTTKVQPRPVVSLLTRAVAFLLLVMIGLSAQGQVPRGGEAQRRGGPGTGNPDEHLVPWKFLDKGAPLTNAPIIGLYWLPTSREELQRSPLLTSRSLLEADLRCVSLLVVLPDDAATLEKLGATGKLPAAVLMNAQGVVIRRVENSRGVLRPAAVEQMVSDELGVRDEAMYHDMAEARKRAASGDKEVAIRLYQKIWDDRCLFPLAGTEAQRGLKALGVIVVEVPKPLAVDPGLHPLAPTSTAPQRKPPAEKRPDSHN